MKRKNKKILNIGLLLVAAIGLTALISYGSSGFSKWDKESWKERFVIAQDDDDDDDTTTDPDEDNTIPYTKVYFSDIFISWEDDDGGYGLVNNTYSIDGKYVDFVFDVSTEELLTEKNPSLYLIFEANALKFYKPATSGNSPNLNIYICEDNSSYYDGIFHKQYFNNVFHSEIIFSFSHHDFETPEEPAPQARNVGVQMAYGQDGAQTLTVDVTPANADIDLSYSVDKSQVTVTKTGPKTASVYVSTYYAGYATITVTDAISGISATGKVYSYQKTQLEVIENLAHGLDGEMVISNNANRAVTEDVTAVSYEYLRPPNEQYTPSGQWVYPFETIYIHIAYSGSFAPSLECKNGDQTTYVIANDVASNPGNKVATFAVNIADNSDSSIGGICNIYVYRSPLWTYGGMKLILAKLQLNYVQGVSGMSVPDLTFTD